MNEKLKLLGQPVRVEIAGHMTTVFLIGYDASDDSYNGMACVDGTIRVNAVGGTEGIATSIGAQQFGAGQWLLVPTLRIQGLRPYPVKIPGRELEAFQFVFPGEDEQSLIDIGKGGIPPPPDSENVVDVSEGNTSGIPSSPAPKPPSRLTSEEQRKLDKREKKGK